MRRRKRKQPVTAVSVGALEKLFEQELEVFRTEVQSALQCFYGFLTITTITDGEQHGRSWVLCSSLRHFEIGEINQAPDFMFSLKARYHGGTTVEMGARWFGRITKSIAEVLKKLIPD